MSGFQGKLNIYCCKACRGHIVTRDMDEGVTPMFLGCRATLGCKGQMASSMYRVFDQSMLEGFQWYRPTAVEAVPDHSKDHVAQGGLLLRDRPR